VAAPPRLGRPATVAGAAVTLLTGEGARHTRSPAGAATCRRRSSAASTRRRTVPRGNDATFGGPSSVRGRRGAGHHSIGVVGGRSLGPSGALEFRQAEMTLRRSARARRSVSGDAPATPPAPVLLCGGDRRGARRRRGAGAGTAAMGLGRGTWTWDVTTAEPAASASTTCSRGRRLAAEMHRRAFARDRGAVGEEGRRTADGSAGVARGDRCAGVMAEAFIAESAARL